MDIGEAESELSVFFSDAFHGLDVSVLKSINEAFKTLGWLRIKEVFDKEIGIAFQINASSEQIQPPMIDDSFLQRLEDYPLTV